MLSSLPLVALFLAQYTMVTIEAPVATLGGASTGVSSSADLEGQLGDLVIPQEEKSNSTSNATTDTTNTEVRKSRAVTDYASLLDDIGDLRLPSNITVGHVAKVAKQAVPSMSDAEIISIVQALHPKPLGSHP